MSKNERRSHRSEDAHKVRDLGGKGAWEDQADADAGEPGSGTSTPKPKSEHVLRVERYLDGHNLVAHLENALNKIVGSGAADPKKELAAYFAEVNAPEVGKPNAFHGNVEEANAYLAKHNVPKIVKEALEKVLVKKEKDPYTAMRHTPRAKRSRKIQFGSS